MKKLLIMAVAMLATASLNPPAYASVQSIVVGHVISIDGSPAQGLPIRFQEKTDSGQYGTYITTVRTGSRGQFAVSLPRGNYFASIYQGQWYGEDKRCLSTRFEFQAAEDNETLDITLPPTRNYKIKYATEGTKSTFSFVNTSFYQLYYTDVPNEKIGNPKFYCDRITYSTVPVKGIDIFGYELAASAPVTDVGSFMPPHSGYYEYTNATGQSTRFAFPMEMFESSNLVISLGQSLPSMKILKKSVKFTNSRIQGKARFTELDSLRELDLERVFSLSLAWVGPKSSPLWSTGGGGKLKLKKNNTIKFSTKITNVYRDEVKLTFRGRGFGLTSNVVTLRLR